MNTLDGFSCPNSAVFTFCEMFENCHSPVNDGLWCGLESVKQWQDDGRKKVVLRTCSNLLKSQLRIIWVKTFRSSGGLIPTKKCSNGRTHLGTKIK